MTLVRGCVIVGAALVCGVAHAHPAGLHWSAGAGCPDERGFAARVERNLGRPLQLGDLPASVDVQVAREEQGWRARVQPRGDTVREIRGATCDEVSDAAALFVSLLAAPERVIEPPPRPSWQGWIGTRGGADWGDLPSITPLIGVEAAAESGPVRLELAGTAGWGGETEMTGRGADFRLWTVGAGLCWDAGPAWLCGGIEGGRITAEGFGFDGAQDGASPWGAASAGVGRDVRFGRFRLGARAEVVVPFVPARFVFGEGEVIHETPAAAGRVRLHLEARFF